MFIFLYQYDCIAKLHSSHELPCGLQVRLGAQEEAEVRQLLSEEAWLRQGVKLPRSQL